MWQFVKQFHVRLQTVVANVALVSVVSDVAMFSCNIWLLPTIKISERAAVPADQNNQRDVTPVQPAKLKEGAAQNDTPATTTAGPPVHLPDVDATIMESTTSGRSAASISPQLTVVTSPMEKKEEQALLVVGAHDQPAIDTPMQRTNPKEEVKRNETPTVIEGERKVLVVSPQPSTGGYTTISAALKYPSPNKGTSQMIWWGKNISLHSFLRRWVVASARKVILLANLRK